MFSSLRGFTQADSEAATLPQGNKPIFIR